MPQLEPRSLMSMNTIFKNHPLKKYMIYSVIAAVAYLIVAGFFISYGSFTAIWLLYVGNMLFALTIAIFILIFNRKRKENASAGLMISAGHITTVMGILIVCALILLTYL